MTRNSWARFYRLAWILAGVFALSLASWGDDISSGALPAKEVPSWLLPIGRYQVANLRLPAMPDQQTWELALSLAPDTASPDELLRMQTESKVSPDVIEQGCVAVPNLEEGAPCLCILKAPQAEAWLREQKPSAETLCFLVGARSFVELIRLRGLHRRLVPVSMDDICSLLDCEQGIATDSSSSRFGHAVRD